MTRDSFVFYRSFFDGLSALNDADRLACYDAIVKYGLDGISEAAGVAAAVLALVKPVMDTNNQKYLNGTKGGRPKKPDNNPTITKEKPNNNLTETKEEPNSKQTKPTRNPMINDIGEMIKEEKKNIQKEKTVFKKPTVDEVRDYCRERGNNVDPNAFVDFYAAKGWRVGNQPMKDWKACVRTWERRDQKEPPKKKVGFSNYESQRQYSDDQFRAIERMMRR